MVGPRRKKTVCVRCVAKRPLNPGEAAEEYITVAGLAGCGWCVPPVISDDRRNICCQPLPVGHSEQSD